MAADLWIHIFKDITEEDIRVFFSNAVGSKYFNTVQPSDEERREALNKLARTPGVWVGEVSWLKASLTGDNRYVPEAVERIFEIIGEDLPVIDDELIARIEQALRLPNNSIYSVSEPEPVIEFLRQHKGERCFTITW